MCVHTVYAAFVKRHSVYIILYVGAWGEEHVNCDVIIYECHTHTHKPYMRGVAIILYILSPKAFLRVNKLSIVWSSILHRA